MTFGEKLASLRKQANLTQEELAEKLDLSRQAITKWERGMGLPDLDNAQKLSSIFNVSLDELLDYKVETIKLPSFENFKEFDKNDFKLETVNKYVIEKYKKASSIYWLYFERYLGFWKSWFYTLFDIDIMLAVSDTIDLINKKHNFAYLVEENNQHKIILVAKDHIITKTLEEKFDKKHYVLDGYKYTKIQKNKIK